MRSGASRMQFYDRKRSPARARCEKPTYLGHIMLSSLELKIMTDRRDQNDCCNSCSIFEPMTRLLSNAHEIDFRIIGEEMQCVEIELDPSETVIAEAGSFMSMEEGIDMETIFGDGSKSDTSFMGKLFNAGKRILTGESLFMTAFSNVRQQKARVSFASPYPGKIIPLDLAVYDNKIICQKDAFLCAAQGVSVGIEFSKRLGRGLFGGEGFIMQSLEGDGLTFVHAGGTVIEKELKPGEVFMVDTGCLVAMTRQVDYDIEMVKGIKNAIISPGSRNAPLTLAFTKNKKINWILSSSFDKFCFSKLWSLKIPKNQPKQKSL